jgi:hypothetical protein
MNITNAQYLITTDEVKNVTWTSVQATIDGQVMSVPLEPTNRHYAEILKQVEAGTLTIADA